MRGAERFIDTNVLLYLLSADGTRANRAEEIVADGGVISVQVLNEFAAVATRKLGMQFAEVREALGAIRSVCAVVPIDEATHDAGMRVAERYGFSIHDAIIVASALGAGCKMLLTEDMQDGLKIERQLRISNPFEQRR